MAQSVGAANLAAGLQDPFLANSPVMAITGRRPQSDQYQHSYQEIDHIEPFNAVTKYNVLVNSPEQLPQFLRQGFRAAVSGTPGPVHLDFEGTTGVVIGDGEADLDVQIDAPFAAVPPFRPEPSLELVREAAQVISQARRPVIVAGGGVVASGAQPELVELAEMLSIPVVTSLNAKGSIPENHPLAIGVVGNYSRWCANRVVAEADLVIYLGSSTGSQVTNEWRIPAPGTPTVQVDINAAELGRSYPGPGRRPGRRQGIPPQAHGSDGTPRAAGRMGGPRPSSCATIGGKRFPSTSIPTPPPMRPERLCQEISNFLPSDSVLVSDTGHAGIWTGTMLDLNHPEQSYIRCAGSLGWGFPAALGAKCAAPERPVLCFTGDGGFWYHLTELETARRYGINTVTVVNNNRSLNQEKRGNERTYGGQTAGSDELWMLSDVDFGKVAESMGCFGIRVERPGDLQSALEQAIASNLPAVVDVVSDIDGIAPQAWTG